MIDSNGYIVNFYIKHHKQHEKNGTVVHPSSLFITVMSEYLAMCQSRANKKETSLLENLKKNS